MIKLKAPEFILETECPDTRFFILFAWYIAQKWGMRTAYYIHTNDIYIFFGRRNTYMGNSIIAPDVFKWLKLAKYNKALWRFNFTNADYNEIDYPLEGDKYIAMWWYLMQLEATEGLLREEHLGLLQRWKKPRLPRETRKWLVDRETIKKG